MFLTEFIVILILVAAIFLIYKFRHEILDWLNRKPTKLGPNTIRDLKTLEYYNVSDPVELIITKEKHLEESKAKLDKELRAIKNAVKQESEKAETGE